MAWYDFPNIFSRLIGIDRRLAAMKCEMDAQAILLGKVAAAILGNRQPTGLHIAFEQTQLLNKQGVLVMSGSISCTDDHDMRVPLVWTDDVGKVAAPAAAGTTAVSDTPATCTVDVAPDDASIVVRTVADGTASITVTNGTLTDTITVTVGPPTASALAVDAADAVQIVKGTAA